MSSTFREIFLTQQYQDNHNNKVVMKRIPVVIDGKTTEWSEISQNYSMKLYERDFNEFGGKLYK